MRARHGFTLLEVLVCIGIILLVAGIGYAVMAGAKKSAFDAVSVSNLKQIYIQTSLYQEEYGGGGVYGTVYDMNLPFWPVSDRIPLLDELRPPRHALHSQWDLGQTYKTLFVQPELDGLRPSWREYALTAQENSVLFIDPFINEVGVPLRNNNYITRQFLAISLSGRLLKVRKRGNWENRFFWPPDDGGNIK